MKKESINQNADNKYRKNQDIFLHCFKRQLLLVTQVIYLFMDDPHSAQAHGSAVFADCFVEEEE